MRKCHNRIGVSVFRFRSQLYLYGIRISRQHVFKYAVYVAALGLTRKCEFDRDMRIICDEFFGKSLLVHDRSRTFARLRCMRRKIENEART